MTVRLQSGWRGWGCDCLPVSPFGNKCVKKQNGSSLHAEQRVGPESLARASLRERESSRRSLLCIFPLESKARTYTQHRIFVHEHAFIFYSDHGKKEAEKFLLLKNSIKCHAHTPPTQPTPQASHIYTRWEREKRSWCAERRARDTHTSQVNAALFCADTHHPRFVVFGENGMAQGQLTLAMPFSLLNRWRGFVKHNKAPHQTQLLQNYCFLCNKLARIISGFINILMKHENLYIVELVSFSIYKNCTRWPKIVSFSHRFTIFFVKTTKII